MILHFLTACADIPLRPSGRDPDQNIFDLMAVVVSYITTSRSVGCYHRESSASCTLRSKIVKRSVVIAGHNTSVTLEEGFWEALKEIADDRGTTPSQLIDSIDNERNQSNLSSAIRVFILENIRKR